MYELIMTWFVILPLELLFGLFLLYRICSSVFNLLVEIKLMRLEGKTYTQCFNELSKNSNYNASTQHYNSSSTNNYRGYTSSDYSINPSFYNLPANVNNRR